MHRSIKTFLHVFFWLIYLVFAGVMSFEFRDGASFIREHLDVFLLNWVWAAIAFYVLYSYGYRIFERKRYVLYGVWTTTFSILLAFTFFAFYWLVFANRSWFSWELCFTTIPGTFVLANCGSLVRGFESWFDAVKRKEELEKSNLQLELESLRSQINPHFLFNTLNNIDSQIHSHPDAASASLVRLAEIMRYILYIGVDSQVDIQKEVEHIENVIALQSMRHSSPGIVQFTKQLECATVQIAPLLFVPFIENAFKYASLDQGHCIEIQLRTKHSEVEFHCRNAVNPEKQERSKDSGGIGLANVKRRLELLYPGRYTLEIHHEKNTFSVSLRIQVITYDDPLYHH